MAKTEQSRQKKLAKKRSKEVAKRKRLASEKNAMQSIGGQIAAAMRIPIDRCYAYDSLFDGKDDSAIGGILVARPIPDGRVVFACFLIDKACLGVKDAFARLVTPSQFSEHLDDLRSHTKIIKCEPTRAKKLVTDSVKWAGQFGLAPLGDYQRVSQIWSDVDESECDQTFQFGQDGKPSYIQGPNDSPEFVARVMSALATHAGEGNYYFTHQLGGFDSVGELIDIDEDSFAEGNEIVLPDGERLIRIDQAE